MKKKLVTSNVKYRKRIPMYQGGVTYVLPEQTVTGIAPGMKPFNGYSLDNVFNNAGVNDIALSSMSQLQSQLPEYGSSTGGSALSMIGGPLGIAQIIGDTAGGMMSAFGNKMPDMSQYSATGQQYILDADDKAETAQQVLGNIPIAGSLLSGIASLFGAKKRRKAAREAKEADNYMKKSESINQLNAALLQYSDNSAAFSMAYGGEVPSSLAYVDGGEVLQTPQGETTTVYDNSGKTDNVLVDIPVGTKILSDTLKVPGTKQTFAQYYKTHSSKRPKDLSTDRRRLNAQQLNELNNQKLMDELIQLQNEEQMRKGVRNRTKKLIPAKALGDGKFGSNLLKRIVPTLQDLGSDLTALAPTFYNLKHADDYEEVIPRKNPYGMRAIETLQNRSFNPNIPLRMNQSTYSNAIENLNKSNTGGSNAAAKVALANNKYLADMDVYTQKHNIDNQYASQLASMLDNVGRQDIASMLTYDDINRRNLAAGRTAKVSGLEGLSQFAQLKKKNRKQQQMQDLMFPLYDKFLSRGVESDALANMWNQYFNSRPIGG